MFSVASLHLAFRHFGTRETLGCSKVDKSRVQKVRLRHSSGNSTHLGETPLTIVKTRVRRELGLCILKQDTERRYLSARTRINALSQYY